VAHESWEGPILDRGHSPDSPVKQGCSIVSCWRAVGEVGEMVRMGEIPKRARQVILASIQVMNVKMNGMVAVLRVPRDEMNERKG